MKTQLFHAGERTDMTKRMVAFRNFANASKTFVCVYDLFKDCVSNSYYTYSME
jgi:hypothetical protein